MNFSLMTIEEVLQLQEEKKVTPQQVWDFFLRKREEWEPRINSFITVINRMEGNGIPAGIKDNITVKGLRTTCGSRMLDNYIAPYSATAWERLSSAGFSLSGKTNLDEFAMGSSTENSYYGPTKNPWDLERSPGGSSGGSAAAVAAGMVKFALGSDTGGSVRQPSSFCGVVGFKPTYGRISRFGLVAFASSLDQIGIITNNVKDSAFVFSTIAGHDPRDSTSSRVPVPDYREIFTEVPGKFTFAFPDDEVLERAEPEVRKEFSLFINLAKKLGGRGKQVKMPLLNYAMEAYYIVANAEASSNLARYDGVRYGLREKAKDLLEMYIKTRTSGFGPEVKRRILTGGFVLSRGYYEGYYGKAVSFRRALASFMEEIFSSAEFLLIPTTPHTAFKLGEKHDPIEMYLEDFFTVFVNLAGLPAISIPWGLINGLPIGFQIVSRWYNEIGMFRLAYLMEKEISFKNKLIQKEV